MSLDQSTRPPNQPPTAPPPSGPPPPAPPPKSQARDDIFALADSLGFQSPARQGIPSTAVAAAVGFPLSPGGPVQDSGREKSARPDGGAPGDRHTPAVAADVPGKVRECKGRAVGADGAATFTLPPIPTVPCFDNGPTPWPPR